jgi:hypothetical protein
LSTPHRASDSADSSRTDGAKPVEIHGCRLPGHRSEAWKRLRAFEATMRDEPLDVIEAEVMFGQQ